MRSGNLRARVAGLCVIAGVILLGLGVMSPTVNAANNPLSGWTQQGGDAVWQVQPAGNSVYRVAPNPNFDNANGPISFFVSPANVGGTFRVTLSANPDSAGEEGDYIGFALGYTAPLNDAACTNAAPCNTSFYLFDWKKDTELEGGNPLPAAQGGQEGFSLMRVQGARDLQNNNTQQQPACFWTHQDVDNFCDVVGTTFGSTQGYEFGVSYTFEVTYLPNLLRIILLGTGGAPDRLLYSFGPAGGTTFPAGRLAFYNYSQPEVEYAYDDGTVTTTTTTTQPTTSTTAGTTATTAGTSGTTTPPTVGPATRSSIVRTGQSTVTTSIELLGGALLLAIGALMTATRGKRPEGAYYLR